MYNQMYKWISFFTVDLETYLQKYTKNIFINETEFESMKSSMLEIGSVELICTAANSCDFSWLSSWRSRLVAGENENSLLLIIIYHKT